MLEASSIDSAIEHGHLYLSGDSHRAGWPPGLGCQCIIRAMMMIIIIIMIAHCCSTL
jgi:hypothetical protein